MADELKVLTDTVIQEMTKVIDFGSISPKDFSNYLGFPGAAGSNAVVMNMVMLNPQGSYRDLLHKYVNKHGTRTDSALDLRSILRKNGVTLAAEVLEKELKRLNIQYYDEVPDLPSPPSAAPGSEEASAGVKEAEPAEAQMEH